MTRFMPSLRVRAALALVLFGPSALHAGVLIVDAVNGPFLTIQSAVNAATAGDLILIDTGMYAGFTIDGKSVSVILDVDANVAISGPVIVKNLPASANVALSRLSIQGVAAQGPEGSAALRILDCAGHVRVEVCTLRGGDGGALSGCQILGHPDAAPALLVRNCADVGVTLSSLTGGKGQYVVELRCDGTPSNGGRGAEGFLVVDSIVAIYDSVTTGGVGGTAWWTGGSAGAGVVVRDTATGAPNTSVFASNVVFDGSAKGGSAVDYFCCPTPGAGGSAIKAIGACTVRFLDGALLSGVSGANIWGTSNIPAPLIDSSAGASVSSIPGDSKGFAIPRLLREGQSSALTFVGVPGEPCFLLLAASMQHVYLPTLKGSLLLSTPFIGPVGFGVVGATGTLQVPLTAPALPSGVDSLAIELQGWVSTGSSSATLTGSAHLTILSSNF